jgi:hypothetical protein
MHLARRSHRGPGDVADAVAFLASEDPGSICGAYIDEDGGHRDSILRRPLRQ